MPVYSVAIGQDATSPQGPAWDSCPGSPLVSVRIHISFLLVPVTFPTCLCDGTFVTVLLQWLVFMAVSPSRWGIPEGSAVCGKMHEFGAGSNSSSAGNCCGLGQIT